MSEVIPLQEVADILKDCAYKMKKKNGDVYYHQYAFKSMWNSSAKMIEEKFVSE